MTKLVVVALILCVTVKVTGARDDEPGRVLAESDFLWDSDGWGVSDEAPDGITHVSKMVKAGDGGPELWHFVAPDKFLGNMRDAYGGALFFRHGFYEYDSQGKDMIESEFDILLVSEANAMTLGKRGVVPPWEFSSEHRLELNELGGWVISETGSPPSRLDMIRVLSKLSGLWIRGGYYAGHEDSYIMDVRIVAGSEGPKDPSKSSLRQQNLGENMGDGGKRESAGMFGRMFGGFSGKEKDGL